MPSISSHTLSPKFYNFEPEACFSKADLTIHLCLSRPLGLFLSVVSIVTFFVVPMDFHEYVQKCCWRSTTKTCQHFISLPPQTRPTYTTGRRTRARKGRTMHVQDAGRKWSVKPLYYERFRRTIDEIPNLTRPISEKTNNRNTRKYRAVRSVYLSLWHYKTVSSSDPGRGDREGSRRKLYGRSDRIGSIKAFVFSTIYGHRFFFRFGGACDSVWNHLTGSVGGSSGRCRVQLLL